MEMTVYWNVLHHTTHYQGGAIVACIHDIVNRYAHRILPGKHLAAKTFGDDKIVLIIENSPGISADDEVWKHLKEVAVGKNVLARLHEHLHVVSEYEVGIGRYSPESGVRFHVRKILIEKRPDSREVFRRGSLCLAIFYFPVGDAIQVVRVAP